MYHYHCIISVFSFFFKTYAGFARKVPSYQWMCAAAGGSGSGARTVASLSLQSTGERSGEHVWLYISQCCHNFQLNRVCTLHFVTEAVWAHCSALCRRASRRNISDSITRCRRHTFALCSLTASLGATDSRYVPPFYPQVGLSFCTN